MSNDLAETDTLVAAEMPAICDVFGDSEGEPMDVVESANEEADRCLHN